MSVPADRLPPDTKLFQIIDPTTGIDWGEWPGVTAIEAVGNFVKNLTDNAALYQNPPLTVARDLIARPRR